MKELQMNSLSNLPFVIDVCMPLTILINVVQPSRSVKTPHQVIVGT